MFNWWEWFSFDNVWRWIWKLVNWALDVVDSRPEWKDERNDWWHDFSSSNIINWTKKLTQLLGVEIEFRRSLDNKTNGLIDGFVDKAGRILDNVSDSIKLFLVDLVLLLDTQIDELEPKEFRNRVLFLWKILDYLYWIPEEVSIWQSILESWHWTSLLSKNANNPFWIKIPWSDKYVSEWIEPECLSDRTYIKMLTSEVRGWVERKEFAYFEKFESLESAFFKNYLLFLQKDRYKWAKIHSNDPKKFLAYIHKAWYATDPKYVSKVMKIAKQYSVFT